MGGHRPNGLLDPGNGFFEILVFLLVHMRMLPKVLRYSAYLRQTLHDHSIPIPSVKVYVLRTLSFIHDHATYHGVSNLNRSIRPDCPNPSLRVPLSTSSGISSIP